VDEGPASKAPAPIAVRGAPLALGVLTLVNLFNYLDRFVVSALVESLKASDMRLSDGQIGTLGTAFMVVYMVASPVFGTLGDRRGRPRLIAFGVLLWSVATALAGRATDFIHLFAARATVGIGEAAYGTIAPSLLSDFFPKSARGRVLSVFFMAIPVGSALGYILGGYVDHHYGWRAAFYVAGLPGILLALLCLLVSDPPRGAQDGDADAEPSARPAPGAGPRSALAAYASLLSIPRFRFAVAGYTAYTFAIGALAFWVPAFLVRMRGVPKQDATVQFGIIAVATGFVGTFAGGWIGDRLQARRKEGYLWVCGVSALLSVPFAAAALVVPTPSVYLPCIVLAELLLFTSTGPVNSAMLNSVPPAVRASSVAACNFTIHLLGDVPSPPLVGVLSDASDLGRALLLVPAAILLAGILWTWGAVAGERKGREAPARG
jgi:MFS family permease